MASTPSQQFNEMEYEYSAAALSYLQHLYLEDFSEATDQARQRRITLQSLELLHARRSDIHVFNKLLVQYPQHGEESPGQVMPDNMVVHYAQPLVVEGSFDVPLQPVGPFWMLEYLPREKRRKKRTASLARCERELKVPYYLLSCPGTADLTLFRHNGKKYVPVLPDEHGRHPLPELDLEVGLLDGWVRYWYQGKLLLLPAEMQQELDEARQTNAALQRQLDEAKRARQAAEAELAQLRGQAGRRARRNGNG